MTLTLIVLGMIVFGCATDSNSAPSDEDATTDSEPRDTDSASTVDENDGGSDSETDDSELPDTVTGETVQFHIDTVLASEVAFDAPGTVGIVTWSVDNVEVDRAEILFGLTDGYGMVAPVDLDEPEYRTLLLGMKPNSTYHFKIQVESGGDLFESENQTIETGPESNLVTLSAAVLDDALHEPGYILSTQLLNAGSGDHEQGSIVFILDPDGDIVWWYQSRVGQTSRVHISYDKKKLWLIPDRGSTDSAEIELVTLDTLESTVFDVGASHDAIPAGEGMLAFIEYGEGDCGSIFELYENGDTIEIWESSELLPGLVPNECHTNSIRYYESEGLYSVSDYAIDIFVIDTAGELQWRLTDYIPNSEWGGNQHGHQLLENGIVLFANRGGEGGRSAVIEYALPSGEEVFKYDPGLRSSYYGDVQRLPGGNTLANFSVSGTMHEVTPEGELVMTIEGEVFGYAVWHASLYPDAF